MCTGKHLQSVIVKNRPVAAEIKNVIHILSTFQPIIKLDAGAVEPHSSEQNAYVLYCHAALFAVRQL